AMADSIDRRFTQAGADVPVPDARRIGVSGVPAWYVSLRGEVRPPRNDCTPPTIRFDTIAVSTRGPDGAPASLVFVLMAEEGEAGVQPTATIAAVVPSLRYDVSVGRHPGAAARFRPRWRSRGRPSRDRPRRAPRPRHLSAHPPS